MDIDGDTLPATAPLHPDGGAAYVFERSPSPLREGGGAWTEIVELRAADPQGGARFGATLALDGTSLLVGSRARDELGTNSGAAHAFENMGGAWVPTQNCCLRTAMR